MISWKGASPFSGGRGEGVVFQMGEGGFIFKWGVRPMGGIGFDGGFEKIRRGRGGVLPPLPPLWETLKGMVVLFIFILSVLCRRFQDGPRGSRKNRFHIQ